MVESALIFEVEKWGTAPGWVQRFDKLILVTVPDEVKIARFVARMGAHDAAQMDARARLAMQIPDSEKAGRCDYVIDNTGSLEATRALVEKTYQELVRFSSPTRE
jgi:dephospho-CoA kinase